MVQGLVAKVRPFHPEDDFSQPGTLFRKVFDDYMRTATINNLAGHLMTVRQDIKERCVKMFYKADGELGNRLGQLINVPAVKSKLWLPVNQTYSITIISSYLITIITVFRLMKEPMQEVSSDRINQLDETSKTI